MTILGSAKKITATTSDTATSVTVDVLAPDKTVLVSGASMTNTSGNDWEYVYQSSASGDEGKYYFVIKASANGYTFIAETSEEFRNA